MKKLFLWGIPFFALCFMRTGYAQNTTGLTCDQKAEGILKFKNDFKNYPAALIDEMIAYITPCAEEAYGKTNPSSAYAKGLLHLQKGDYTTLFGARRELSYLHLFRASYHKYPSAMLDHTINLLTNTYKENYQINYNNMSRDLENLVTLDYKKDITNYILGYIHLKNLVTNQDFTNTTLVDKAKGYFDNSNHPMAKHWLGIMNYFGYGMPKDTAKALQMLSENNILNSQTLKQQLQNQNNDWIPISAAERLASIENYSTNNKPITVIGSGKTTFQGHFIEFDWTATGVKRYIPVTLSITIREEHETYKKVRTELTIDGKTIINDPRLQNLAQHTQELHLFFGQFLPLKLPPLPNMLQDHPDKNTTSYSIESLYLKEASIGGKPALIAKAALNTTITELNEVVHTPIRMVLYPQSPAVQAMAETTPLENSKQQAVLDKDFAVISPNPIGDRFTITYNVGQSAEVQVSVYDFYGQQKIQLPSQKIDTSGKQTITVDSAALLSGTYVIQITVDSKAYSKTVVKL